MNTRKLFIHTLVYFTEIIMMTSLIRWLVEGDLRTSNMPELLKEVVFAYTAYQLLLLMTFKLKDSVNVDGLSAVKNQFDRLQIYAEFKMKVPEDVIIEIKERLIDNAANTLNKYQRVLLNLFLEQTQRYNKEEITSEVYRFMLKQESRAIDAEIKTLGYHWMNCIALRLLK